MEDNIVIENNPPAPEKIVVQERPAGGRPVKSPALAGILSFFFPFGVGPFYNGETVKGFIYLVIFAGLVSLQGHGNAQPFGGLLLAGFYFYQIIDSVTTANRFNRRTTAGLAPEEDETLAPEALKSGSIFWGLLLILIGTALLLGNFGAVSYRVIFDFWPVVVIVIGVKLVFDYYSRNRT